MSTPPIGVASGTEITSMSVDNNNPSTASDHGNRDWMLLTALTFLFSFGFATYSGVFQNFLRDLHHAGPVQLGGLESTREIPGLLAALMAGTLVAFAEIRIAVLGLALTGIGIGATGLMP